MTDVDFQMANKNKNAAAAAGGANAGLGLPMPQMMNIVNHPDRDTFGAPLHHLRFKRDQPGSPFHSTTTVHIPTESHPKTAMEVIEQMSDISGTITTLMRENVQLRTKLLNTKAPFWKKLMVNLQSSRTLFDEWRKAVNLMREERRRAEVEARYMESIGQHQAALSSVHQTKDQRIEQLEKELEIAINHTKTLQDEVKKRDVDIQRYVKFFHEAQESFANAAATNLPEDRDDVDLGFDLNHPAYKDERSQPDPLMISELVVSKLHDILEAVDGRYVAPLQRGKNMHRRVKDVNELFHGYRMIQEKREALGSAGAKKLQPLKFDFNVPKMQMGGQSPGGDNRDYNNRTNDDASGRGRNGSASPTRGGGNNSPKRVIQLGGKSHLPQKKQHSDESSDAESQINARWENQNNLMFAGMDYNLSKAIGGRQLGVQPLSPHKYASQQNQFNNDAGKSSGGSSRR